MLKAEKLDEKLQQLILRLKMEGWSARAIADKLNAEYDTELFPEDVSNLFKKREKEAIKMANKPEFQEKIIKQYFDTIEQLKRLNGEMWSFFYALKQDPEKTTKSVSCPKCRHIFKVQVQSFQALLKTADHLLKQIQHVDTVLGRMQKKQINVTYNYVDLSRKLTQIYPELLLKAERLGLAKINKRKLKEIRKS